MCFDMLLIGLFLGLSNIVLTADDKKEMYIKLLELYEKGLNSWIETFEKDLYKTKKEKHRLNVHKKLLLELYKVVDK